MIENNFPHSFSAVQAQLRKRLAEPAPGFVQMLSGPRQVGKTTLLLSLAKEIGERCFYFAADSPEASLVGWWERLWQTIEHAAQSGKTTVFIDEIHYLAGWNRLLKAQADKIRRLKIPVHIVVSGSSALKLGAASRETMAGRFERLRLLHWPVAELVRRLQINKDEAAGLLVRYGSYPGAAGLLGDQPRWRDYIRSSIIEPAIGRDILAIESVRKPALLRQVFAVCLGYPAEIVALNKICGQLMERGALETVAHYLFLLEEASLVAAIKKYSSKKALLRATPPKLVVLNQALLAAMETIDAPKPENDPIRFGRWVENACLAHAWNAGQTVWYWRAEPIEVDMVIEGSWGKWAVEIKTGAYNFSHLNGILSFCKEHQGFKPLLLCDEDAASLGKDAGIRTLSWKEYLLAGISF